MNSGNTYVDFYGNEYQRTDNVYNEKVSESSIFRLYGTAYLDSLNVPFTFSMRFYELESAEKQYNLIIEKFDDVIMHIGKETSQQYRAYC